MDFCGNYFQQFLFENNFNDLSEDPDSLNKESPRPAGKYSYGLTDTFNTKIVFCPPDIAWSLRLNLFSDWPIRNHRFPPISNFVWD